jgi:hypothetical protein
MPTIGFLISTRKDSYFHKVPKPTIKKKKVVNITSSLTLATNYTWTSFNMTKSLNLLNYLKMFSFHHGAMTTIWSHYDEFFLNEHFKTILSRCCKNIMWFLNFFIFLFNLWPNLAKWLTTFGVRAIVLRSALTPYHHDVAPWSTLT